MGKNIQHFKLLKDSEVLGEKYELRIAMIEDGSQERKFKMIEVEVEDQMVNRSIQFKRSTDKEKIKNFVEDSSLNLEDKEVDDVMDLINKSMTNKELYCLKDMIRGNKMLVYKEMCKLVKEKEIEIIIEKKDGNIRIWEWIMEDILKELTNDISLPEMISFLSDNNLLVHDVGRKKVHISKSSANPTPGWAYCFKDYSKEGDVE